MPLTMDLKIENFEEVARSLDWLSKKSGVGVKDICVDQLRLWVQSFMSTTVPVPKNKGQGVAAVKSDLNKLFVGIDQKPVLDFFEEDFGHGELPSSVIFNLSGDARRMRGFHEKHRRKSGSRAGQVRYKGRIVKRIGEWDFVNKMYVPSKALKSYVKDRVREVGRLKSAWIPSARRLASYVRTTAKYPAWLDSRGKGKGSVSIHTMNQKGSGFVAASNREEVAMDKLGSWIGPTRRLRHVDITKKMNRRLQELADRFEKGRMVA